MSDPTPTILLENQLRQLNLKNEQQAAMIMERDFALLMAKKEIQQMKEMKLTENKLIDINNNVINLEEKRLALASGGPSDFGENWLKALPAGTVFLSKLRNRPKDVLICDLFCVAEQKAVTTNMIQKVPDNRQLDFWFPSLQFSRANELVEIIATVEFGYDKEKLAVDMAIEDAEAPEEVTDKKENDNGDSPRSV